MNRKRNLFTSLGLALVGTLLLVGYVRAAEGRATAGQRMVPVVVVDHDVPQGSTAEELAQNVRVDHVPASARSAGALSSIEALGGRVPAANLYTGEQLLADRLGQPGGVGPELGPGQIAVSLSLEPQRALGGQVQAGTLVTVLASYDQPTPRTETVLRDVLVQSAAESKGPSGAAGEIAKLTAIVEGTILVTLAVDEREAEKLVYAADHGRVWLAGTDNVALEGGR